MKTICKILWNMYSYVRRYHFKSLIEYLNLKILRINRQWQHLLRFWKLKYLSIAILFNAWTDDNLTLSEWREMSQKSFCRYTKVTMMPMQRSFMLTYLYIVFVFHHDSYKTSTKNSIGIICKNFHCSLLRFSHDNLFVGKYKHLPVSSKKYKMIVLGITITWKKLEITNDN